MNTEQIIAANSITNPADATLVRLAEAALSLPNDDVDTLLKRVNFAHPGDATLARAIIETIRANARPRTVAPATPWIAAASASLILAVGLGAWSLNLHSELGNQREVNRVQAEQSANQFKDLQLVTTKRVGELQESTAAALKTSDASTKDNVQLFTKSIEQYVERINGLTAENERLKADLAAAGAHSTKLP